MIWQSATIHKQLEEDVLDRKKEFEFYDSAYKEHGIETFGYFAILQNNLLALSVDYLNAKTRELNALIPKALDVGMKPGPPGFPILNDS
jgi:hypothetical protein